MLSSENIISHINANGLYCSLLKYASSHPILIFVCRPRPTHVLPFDSTYSSSSHSVSSFTPIHAHSFIHSFICLFVDSFAHLFVCLFIHSFVYSFMYPSIHPHTLLVSLRPDVHREGVPAAAAGDGAAPTHHHTAPPCTVVVRVRMRMRMAMVRMVVRMMVRMMVMISDDGDDGDIDEEDDNDVIILKDNIKV